MLSPECDPGGSSPGVPPPELGDRTSDGSPCSIPYAESDELGGLCKKCRKKMEWMSQREKAA